MIYSILSFLIPIIYPFGNDIASEVTFGVTFLLNIGISLIMLPINIRLAGQLVMQVFKYRYICNHVAISDEDNKVMTGYYNHFRSVMCIIISMVGFNVFNIISEVLFLIKFFKWGWGDIWGYWWVAEGLCSGFEESVILYAVVMLYQIACYFQGQKFRFLLITVVIVLRFLYTSIQTGFVINYVWGVMERSSSLQVYFFIIPGIIILEFLLRFPMLFSFVRSTQRVVSKYIDEFLNDMNTEDLDRQHFVDKVLAGKLFQIAGWGTICVSFMTSLGLVLQYFMIISIENFFRVLSVTVLQDITVTILTLIQFFTILPSILYCIFLIALWLYFRDKTKVKYSGYSSDDPEILNRIHRPNNNELSNQDEFHYTYYKRKYTVMNTTYVLCIVVISVLFAGFFAPVLDNQWKWDISLRPGDYHLLEGSILKSDCHNDQLESLVVQNSLNFQFPDRSVDLHCSDNIFAGRIILNETHYTTTTFDPFISNDYLWLPNNSALFIQFRTPDYDYESYMPFISLKSQFPCYYLPYLVNELYLYVSGKDSCNGAEIVPDTGEHTCRTCNYSKENASINCTVTCNGMYWFHTTSSFETVTVKKFGYAINESSIIPFHELKGEQLHKYDVILFNPTVNITGNSDICSIHATCRFHLAFRILMPVLIFLSSMLLLTIGLVLIHKI